MEKDCWVLDELANDRDARLAKDLDKNGWNLVVGDGEGKKVGEKKE